LLLFVSPIISASSEEIPEILLEHPWDHSPITVYIDNKSVPEHYSPTYYTQIEKALEYWEDGGNGKLKYTPVFKLTDSKDADITIRWVDNLESVEGAPSGVAGYALPTVANNRYIKVEIVLEVGNYKGRSWNQYGDETMFSIAKHELGHALGLGHSREKGDIMYPEYELRDNINPILLTKYGPYLRIATYASIAIVVFLAVSWLLSRRERKKLEKKYNIK
jgi:predicted Zn-dependent protease